MKWTEILKILQFPADIAGIVEAQLYSQADYLEANAPDAYLGAIPNIPIAALSPMNRLLTVIWLLQDKHERYRRLGVPDATICDTFRDVTLRVQLYYKKHHEIGLSDEDVIWFRHIMNVSIFQIGPVQFQPFEMIYLDEETIGEEYMTFTPAQKKLLPPGSPVINCHIPYGTNLDPVKVSDAFSQANVLFQKLYPDTAFLGFLCYSWLLYPDMQQLLSYRSRIRQFADRFTILSSCPDPEQALENLFYFDSKCNTSLQKAARNHPELFGFACGIIEFIKEAPYEETQNDHI